MNRTPSKFGFQATLWVLLAATALFALQTIPLAPKPLPSIPAIEASRADLTLKDGLLCLPNAEKPFSGALVDRSPNGRLLSRSMVFEGKLHGLSEGWYTNGQVQVREHFLAGVSHGIRTKWHSNGQRLSEGRIVRGNFEGIFRRWHENGALAEQYHMVNGQPEGLAETFYPSGNPQSRAIVREGKSTEVQRWADAGSAASQIARAK